MTEEVEEDDVRAAGRWWRGRRRGGKSWGWGRRRSLWRQGAEGLPPSANLPMKGKADGGRRRGGAAVGRLLNVSLGWSAQLAKAHASSSSPPRNYIPDCIIHIRK
ncbi:hypothetical protein BS78_01G264500 [Paspalum vaginatum]|nr:hypothetical protein BS78_01G264500 [Paspalum vaginatum]